ncbi:DUF885 domain-containing protein [Undibacterium sp. Jales W-56]|uniref:DUF885 domain-containing protein n=1 Tax=Undibacterium sp. Jales W-56 TaxID=2897325 RepID=UPI0021D38894|nr:DUF885 domain-containing protein [Undibacterium sp. Jales W-56]MCU6433241.1 DUF885 domain-containing protein [Undibacterium sp. Jales W-56]
MARFFKWTGRALLVLLLILAIGLVHVWYFKPLKADWFYGRVMARFVLDQPEMLSSMRILPGWLDFYSDKLSDASPAAEQKMADMVHDNLTTLHRYQRDALDRDEQLSYDTMEYFLRMQDEGDQFRYLNFPVNQMFGVQSSLPNFMTDVHQINSVADAKNYIARLNKFPAKFDQVLEGLKIREDKKIIPPQFLVEKVLVQMQGFIAKPGTQNPLYTNFKEKLDKLPADKIDTTTRQTLLAQTDASITQQVYPAYQKLINYFKTQQPKAQGNFGAWHLPGGDAYYAWAVKMHTTTDMTPQQVHDLGLTEVARISTEMDAILKSKGLSEGSVGARVLQLSEDPAQLYPNTPDGKQAMLKGFQMILDEVNKGLDAAFDMRPKLGVEVRAVPEYSQETAPGAYYNAGSFDGSRPGIFYANMRDTKENPKFTMRTLAYHEGIPGHHFQISIAQELQDVPFFRQVLPFTAYAEGWALYAERLAWELGFEKDPMDNLGRLRDEMMRAVRLVVDSGIHYKHWTREQAIQYMTDNTGMALTDVTAEIERYMVDPGQALAYKVGMLKILALREKAKLALGDQFDLKQFHNEVLTHGALPLVVLERVIDDWIAKRKKP